MSEPTTIKECDEQLAYWSDLSTRLGLPVLDDDGGNSIDRLLELRKKLSEAPGEKS